MHLFMDVWQVSAQRWSASHSASYLDQRANVLVLHSTLAANLVETTAVSAVPHGLVLEIALTTLVANRAVERVVGEEELHDALTRLVDERRVRLDYHAWLHRPRARRDWLGSPLHLDQTHTAVAGNHQLLVVAVSRDGASGLLACLDEGGASCSGASGRALQLRAGISEAAYLRLRPSFHLRRLSAGAGAGKWGWHKPIVSSTSAGRGAEAVKARLPLRAALRAGFLSDRINCCRSMLEAWEGGDGASCCGRSSCRRPADSQCSKPSIITKWAGVIGQVRPSAFRMNKIRRQPSPSSLLHSLRAQFIVGMSSHQLGPPLLRAPEHETVRGSWSRGGI